MRMGLSALFGAILLAMLGVTTWAFQERSVFDAGYLFNERWFVATFLDAYFGFITFFVWVAYKETSWIGRIAWFVALMALGNIAIAAYMLIQLVRMRPSDSFESLLLKQLDTPISR